MVIFKVGAECSRQLLPAPAVETPPSPVLYVNAGVLSICATPVRFSYLPLKQWVVQFDNENATCQIMFY